MTARRLKMLMLAFLLALASAAPARADEPRTDASLALSSTRYSQFEDTTLGMTASLSRRLTGWLGAEAQLGFSPSDLGAPSFSASRVEAFLGPRVGIGLGRHRLYAAGRPGFVRLSKPPEPIFCILIYPPPLACSLAAGKTLFGVQLGAGFEAAIGGRSVARFEIGSLLLRYPGPAIARDREAFGSALWSHNGRASVSLGLRF